MDFMSIPVAAVRPSRPAAARSVLMWLRNSREAWMQAVWPEYENRAVFGCSLFADRAEDRVLTIEIQSREEIDPEGGSSLLLVNGESVDDSWGHDFIGEKYGGLYDSSAVETVLSFPIVEILHNLNDLTIPYHVPWCDEIGTVRISNSNRVENTPSLRFEFRFDSENWSKAWSISEFAETIEEVVAQSAIPGLFSFRDDSDFITNGFGFLCSVSCVRNSAREELENWERSLVDVMMAVTQQLMTRTNQNAISTIYCFPEEISAACEQYLIYFGQFLADLGMEANVALSQQANHVLFTVSPKNAEEALDAIKAALDVYLKIPGDSAFKSESIYSTDVAVLQLRANVSHLESQLILAQAILQAKDATIQALQLSNYQLQQLTSLPNAAHSNQQKTTTPSSKDSEPIIKDLVSIRDSEVKGLVIHWPVLLRKLKRCFHRKD